VYQEHTAATPDQLQAPQQAQLKHIIDWACVWLIMMQSVNKEKTNARYTKTIY